MPRLFDVELSFSVPVMADTPEHAEMIALAAIKAPMDRQWDFVCAQGVYGINCLHSDFYNMHPINHPGETCLQIMEKEEKNA